MSSSKSATRGAIAAAMGLLAMVAIGACGDDEPAATGASSSASSSTSAATTGPGGMGQGGSASSAQGGSGGMGQGGSASGGAGGSGGMGQAGSGGCLPTGASCTQADTCCDYAGQTGVCHGFMMGNDPRCTIPCPPNPNDCPAGNGCNNMDVCRIN